MHVGWARCSAAGGRPAADLRRSCSSTSPAGWRARRAIGSSSPRCRSAPPTRSGWTTTTSDRAPRPPLAARRPVATSSTTSCRAGSRRDRPLWELWIADRARRRPHRHRRQGAPLHGRRARGGRARDAAARPDARAAAARGRRLGAPPIRPGRSSLFAGGLPAAPRRSLDIASLPLRAARHPRQALRAPALALEAARALVDSARPARRLPPFVNGRSRRSATSRMARRPLVRPEGDQAGTSARR